MNNEKLQKIGILALKEAYFVHESLGVKGEQEIVKNQYGETVLF